MDVPDRLKTEARIVAAIDAVFAKYREADHNRMPPWSRVQAELEDELASILSGVTEDAIVAMVRKYGRRESYLTEAAGDDPVAEKRGILRRVRGFVDRVGLTGLFNTVINRAGGLLKDVAAVSRRRWRELIGKDKPGKRTPDQVKAWRDQNLGKQRAEVIAATEVTMAHTAGELFAAEYLANEEGVHLEAYWRTEVDPCPICLLLKDKPRRVWSINYPSGPPAPHARCRCFLEWKTREQEAGLA